MKRAEPEELTARILDYSTNYFIARSGGLGQAYADDEAALEVNATIERIARRHLKHLHQPISFRLLHSRRYQGEVESISKFFGSVTLWGSQRYVLAYLPELPFWALPAMIARGCGIIQCTYEPMRGGHGDLLSFYVAPEEFQLEDA